jgi:hypothetical protein
MKTLRIIDARGRYWTGTSFSNVPEEYAETYASVDDLPKTLDLGGETAYLEVYDSEDARYFTDVDEDGAAMEGAPAVAWI